MGYLSAKETALRWKVSERSVRNYCAQGRVQGAFLTGNSWSIPEDAPKPKRSNGREEKQGRESSPLLERLLSEKRCGVKGGIYHKVQVDLTYNSNRIEGSRLSLDQTRLIFETLTVSEESSPLQVNDIVETLNHFRAIDFVIERALEPATESMAKDLHRILKPSTEDERARLFAVGDYKLLPNEVAGRRTTPPELVHREMKRLVSNYNLIQTHSIEDIIEFHVGFERIHPFQDGNGRVGRLLMFKECLSNGIVPFIISDDMKAFYYRGLSEWDYERGYLTDTCLAAQGRFKTVLDYFRIPYSA